MVWPHRVSAMKTVKSLRNTPENLETVNSGLLGNRSAIFLDNNSSMTSQLSLNIGIFRTGDHIFELKTKPTVREAGRTSEVNSTCSTLPASWNFFLRPLNAFLDFFLELSDLPENEGVFLAHKKVL